MSGLFASLSVGKAWEMLSSFLRAFPTAPSSSSSASQHQQGDLEELRKLERTMRRIRATLQDAEEHWNIREESAKLRLKELKEVAYDIEDVVDEYEYEVNRCEVVALDRSVSVPNTGKRKHQEDNESCLVHPAVVAVPHDLVLRARKITDRFNEIIHYSEHLSLSENDGQRRFAPDISSLRHTSSVVFEKSILGRDQDKVNIINKLSGEGRNVGNPVSVMVIVGMGGLGKTTLAQLVYNDPGVSQSFDKHAWVCVSEHFDVNTITRNIITSLASEQCLYTELADLQMKLANEINQRGVLLVLDDIWNERRDSWELFCRPLSTAKFCQILVTTRSEQVARLIQTMPCYHLSCLSSDESWSLFSQAAFIVKKESDIPTNLSNIGRCIVQKCKGLPLAIKTLGSMLRFETDERRWEEVLKNELWEFEQPRNEVLPALELSYKHMPVHLRRCLISLALYPKDYSIFRCAVFQLWKILDLIHCDESDDDYRNAEGELYLKELVQRSMLQINGFPSGSYSLHDLIHDLACFLAGEEFYRLEGDPHTEIPQNIRYMSIHKYITAADISVFPHSVRAIIVLGELGNMNQAMVPKALFSNCKKLRALDISHSKRLQMVLPDYIGNLKLLRHLSLRGEPTMSLQLDPLVKLSVHIKNVALNQIGHLISLHYLSDIRITQSCCSFNIRELRNINQVRKLRIEGLSNVGHIRHANEAQLQRKKHLLSLYLGFHVVNEQCRSCGLQPETVKIPHDQLLDSLRPHYNLRELIISSYDSAVYPSWVGDRSFFMLTTIKLFGGQSKHLPVLGGLPSLKNLHVGYTNSVEDIGRELFIRQFAGDEYFPSLTNLEFHFLSEWSEWSGVDDSEPPCLNELSLLMCEKLSSLPLGPLQCLVILDLRECHSIAMLPALLALRELKIAGCSSLIEIPTLPSLLKLNISKCRNLSSIGLHPSFTTLQPHSSLDPSISAAPQQQNRADWSQSCGFRPYQRKEEPVPARMRDLRPSGGDCGRGGRDGIPRMEVA
ncbi:hypothetical protein C2845_PMPSC048920 [Panicum miliaceum]|uniref:Disease resistance RPP13-like protein 1 n=1 Tax=Panicum miliaceum TaxID=4540 RepID=A0A3L6P982_PANMI|nr:hypothetical protein C2845_PMPSC048920 [Panicum miliaceum]